MTNSKEITTTFLQTLSANIPAQFDQVLHPLAGIRVWNRHDNTVHRPRERVVGYLTQEWSAWRDATLEILSIVADGEKIAVEFRIQATENNLYVEYNRAAFFHIKDGLIETIDLYCTAPWLSARRKGWIAPAHLDEDAVRELFRAWQYSYDIRESIPINFSGTGSMNIWCGGSGDAHPGSNTVIGALWIAGEADSKIQELIEYHRARNISFQWLVNPFDQPSDLRERLERHGLVLAGDQALMARTDLENLDAIPTNHQVTVELVDGSDDDAIEAKLQIIAACFNWTKEQVDSRRPNMYERFKNPIFLEREINFLARLDGVPVADARVILSTGIAYLGGASTLPAYRSHRIYSTMLRRRLEEARARGYNVAAIHAEPMSRRVVSKYGFKEYGRAYLYAWMPVIDMQVIKSLVPDD